MLIMTFPFVYLVMHSFAVWDQVDRRIIPTNFSLRSWTWLFGGSPTSADVPWFGGFCQYDDRGDGSNCFNDVICFDGRLCVGKDRV